MMSRRRALAPIALGALSMSAATALALSPARNARRAARLSRLAWKYEACLDASDRLNARLAGLRGKDKDVDEDACRKVWDARLDAEEQLAEAIAECRPRPAFQYREMEVHAGAVINGRTYLVIVAGDDPETMLGIVRFDAAILG